MAAVSADVFGVGDGGNSFGIVRCRVAALVNGVVAGAIAHAGQQRAVLPKSERAGTVALVEDWRAVIHCVAKQHEPAAGHGAGISADVYLVARDSTDGGVVIQVKVGVVLLGAIIEQVVAVNNVEKVDVAVGGKIGVERKAEQAEVAIGSHFVADVEQGRGLFDTVHHDPNLADGFPDVHATVVVPGKACNLVESVEVKVVGKTSGLCAQVAFCEEKQKADENQDERPIS